MARSTYDTLLSLDRYAKIMGINPAHFNQGYGDAIFPLKSNRCQDLWPQYSWQYQDHVGRDDLGEAIKMAEDDIAEQLGHYPGPKFIEQEPHMFPRPHRPDMWRRYGRGVRGERVSITTNYGKVISPGRRNADTLIGTATVAGKDLVYDFGALTATITLATTLTDSCEIKAFFPGESAAPEWEIRPPKSVTITAPNVVLVFDSWLFIKPELQDAYPTAADWGGIDLTVSNNHIQSVDVYRVFVDTTAVSTVFYWEPRPRLSAVPCGCGGVGCPACALITQDGCFYLRNPESGIIVPTPATYDEDSAAWGEDCFTECRDPDQAKVYYYSGEFSKQYLSGRTCETLSDSWARTIARMATARLTRPFCQCGASSARVVESRTDLAFSGGDTSYNVSPALLDNPFGTRRGEVDAWRQVYRIADRTIQGAAW